MKERKYLCELVSSFLLDALSLKHNKTNIGLYRDDGFAIFRNISGPHCEKIKREFRKLFRHHNLRILWRLPTILKTSKKAYEVMYFDV